MKKASTIVLSAAFVGLMVPGIALAAQGSTFDDPCEGNTTSAVCGELTSGSDQGLPSAMRVVINALLMGIGVVATIMLILGSINYTTSGGDPSKASKARGTITYAIVGLVIALLAFTIVNFVLQWSRGEIV